MDALQSQTATPESVWAILQETNKTLKETAERQKEYDRWQAEYAIRQAEYEKKREKSNEDFDRRMKEINKTLGGWADNHGSFAEEYFYNSFEKGQQNFFGKKFDMIEKKVRGVWKNVQDEYDIVLYNDDAVAIIEVKFKAHKNDIDTVLKKAETFKILCPYYKDYKIYLGLASMAFYPELEQACIDSGIAIIKQVGDKVVINDKHLKVF